uniref:Uncharacterized protein n=1 Tax=Sphaerodactylus townsendi TaxID=933632 RepID=A0ACB8F6G4_9SAUR
MYKEKEEGTQADSGAEGEDEVKAAAFISAMFGYATSMLEGSGLFALVDMSTLQSQRLEEETRSKPQPSSQPCLDMLPQCYLPTSVSPSILDQWSSISSNLTELQGYQTWRGSANYSPGEQQTI